MSSPNEGRGGGLIIGVAGEIGWVDTTVPFGPGGTALASAGMLAAQAFWNDAKDDFKIGQKYATDMRIYEVEGVAQK